MFSFLDEGLPLKRELLGFLQSIKGIGLRKAILISSRFGFSYPFFAGNLNYYKFGLLSFLLTRFALSFERVRRILNFKIKGFISLHKYKGYRHKDFLPVHGQRTRTNASSVRRYRLQR
jgi:ribosomal protein S13